jgi:alkanesulfonate monooxygenase SsuD/methylene tetrahydromethanopterin reductase-like flavin-dependent oxidoreductase (luciferase family)/iron-sulfur cluster repair protein YtfE (RIC family)
VTAYGHDLTFGSFLTPTAASPDTVVALAQLCEQLGLDLVSFQDHPYQPAFLDTWTLMSYVAARTDAIGICSNVLNLPLRAPVVIARSAASLDLLSAGRFELGIGAGGFWDAIEAMGGRRLSPGQSVDALAEAIDIIRQVWASTERGGVRLAGDYYQVSGAKRGPAPAHEIGVWVGALKPRMLRLIGRVADGWVPSLVYLDGPQDLASLNAIIDDSATEAGRSPSSIRRFLNVSGEFLASGRGLLQGPPAQWVEELAEIATTYGTSGFLLASDDPLALQIFAEEVVPAVREKVVVEPLATEPDPVQPNQSAAPTVTTQVRSPDGLTVVPTPDDGVRHSREPLWDEASRPLAPAAEPGRTYTARGNAVGQHLIDVHDHLRTELAQLRDLVEQVRTGHVGIAAARSAVNEMTMRQNDWTLGAYCAQYCRAVAGHHSMEDQAIFPHLRGADTRLSPVIDRLEQEHHVIHGVLESVDAALVHLVEHPGDLSRLDEAVDQLSDTLLSHLSYEENQLVEPLARLGFYAGQV